MEQVADRVVKTMGLTAGEFSRSIVALGPESISPDGCQALFAFATGTVRISCSPQPPAILGGLVRMPRAIVTLDFSDLPPEDRPQFLRRFDIAFQRGGG